MLHIGIIPDGNRRWCKKNNKNYSELVNHWIDEMIMKNVFEFLKNDEFEKFENLFNITELSLYVSSIDNLDRDDKTHEFGYELIEKCYQKYFELMKTLNHEEKTKIHNLLNLFKLNVIGERNLIPNKINVILNECQSIASGNVIVINIAIAYDYKKDLESYRQTNNKNYIRSQSNIDLVIRTGNEKRLSGFFPTKTMYSELIFLEKLWPDFLISDLDRCIKEFNSRSRRFGK